MPEPSLPTDASRDPAIAAWLASTFDPVAVGVLHSLSNRMCALEAIASLPPESRGAQPGRLSEAQLRAEIGQAIDLQRVLRGMFPDTLAREALDLRDVAADAIRLVEHHPVVRRARVALRVTGDAAVTRMPRWAMRRIFMSLLAASAQPGAVELAIEAGTDEHVVTVRTGAAPERPTHAPGMDYIARLATEIGARIESAAEGYRCFVPSLEELRRRERVTG